MRKVTNLMAMLGMGAAMALAPRPEIPMAPYYIGRGRRNVIYRRPKGKASFKQNKRKGL